MNNIKKHTGVTTLSIKCCVGTEKELREILSTRNKSFFKVYNYIRENDGCTESEVKEFFNTKESMAATTYIFRELMYAGLINMRSEPYLGFVYVIHDGYGNYKIGMTNDVKSRLKTYKTYIPYLEVTKVKRVYNYVEYEEMLHYLFREKHIYGEWFKLTKKDINSI